MGAIVVLVITLTGHDLTDQRQPLRGGPRLGLGHRRDRGNERLITQLRERDPIQDFEHVFYDTRHPDMGKRPYVPAVDN